MTAATDRRAVTMHGAQVLPTRGAGSLAANAVIKKGWHVAKNAAGYLVAFTAALALTSHGIAEEDADNTGGADGDVDVDVKYGVTDLIIGTAGDALVNADAPCACYAMDNQTVGKTSGSGARSLAGVFLGVNAETGQARVVVGPMGWFMANAMALGLAAEPAATITTGTATLVAGTVTVTTAAVTAGSKIQVSRKAAGASTAVGELSTPTRTAATSFVITSLNPTNATTQTNDVSTVDWTIIG